MTRPPRRAHTRILTRGRLGRIVVMSVVMAAGTLAVLVFAPRVPAQADGASVASTMALATFVFFQVFNLMNVRHETRSVFRRAALEGISSVLVATIAVTLLLVCVVEIDGLHGFFTTTDLTSAQWLTCVAVASSVLWVGELAKLTGRVSPWWRARRQPRGTRPGAVRRPARAPR